MAISKFKTKLQISLHNEIYALLSEIVKGLNKQGYGVTKSDVIEESIKCFVGTCQAQANNSKEEN